MCASSLTKQGEGNTKATSLIEPSLASQRSIQDPAPDAHRPNDLGNLEFAPAEISANCASDSTRHPDPLKILVAFCPSIVRFRGPRFEMSRGSRHLADESSAVDECLSK